MPKAPFRGSYTCNVRFEGDGNEVVMNLGVIMKSDDDELEVITRNFQVPIYFDYGTRCILPGRRSAQLEEIVPALTRDAA